MLNNNHIFGDLLHIICIKSLIYWIMALTRRTLVSTGLLAGTALLTHNFSSGLAWADNRYAREVQKGLQYFRNLAQQNLTLCQELLAVLRTNDLEKAKLPVPPTNRLRYLPSVLSRPTKTSTLVPTPSIVEKMTLNFGDFTKLKH
jgi:hypothetical protein